MYVSQRVLFFRLDSFKKSHTPFKLYNKLYKILQNVRHCITLTNVEIGFIKQIVLEFKTISETYPLHPIQCAINKEQASVTALGILWN